MSQNQSEWQSKAGDENYLKVFQIEQDFLRTRWTVVTFFLGISFAVFGFSFQVNLSQPRALAIRIAGVFIYWFAYIIYRHFYRYTQHLRNQLIRLEESGYTSFKIQSRSHTSRTGLLLLCFGFIYTIGVVLLVFLRL